MNITRRRFLQLLSAAPLVAAVPALAKTEDKHDFGTVIDCNGRTKEEVFQVMQEQITGRVGELSPGQIIKVSRSNHDGLYKITDINSSDFYIEPVEQYVGIDMAKPGTDKTIMAQFGRYENVRYIETKPLELQHKPIHNINWQKFTARKSRRMK